MVRRFASKFGLTLLGTGLLFPSVGTLAGQQVRPLPVPDVVMLNASCSWALERAEANAEALRNLPLDEVSVETVLDVWDRDEADLGDVTGPIAVLNNVHPDAEVRAAGEQCLQEVTDFDSRLYQDEALYQRIAAVQPHDPVAKKLQEDILEDFEDAGVSLPVASRDRAREITSRLTELRQEFERNLRDDNTRLVFTPDEYRGVPESYLEGVSREGDNIVVGTSSPEYITFMRNAVDEDARRRFYLAYVNVGAPRNIEILDEISRLRRELAVLHGKPSYASYILQHRMAGSPETVAAFLRDVEGRVTDIERSEYQEMRAMKASMTDMPLETTELNPWDVGYYRERLREQRTNIDQEMLRKFFPTEPTVAWALGMSSRLYGVTFEEKEVPVWHPEVRYFEVRDSASDEVLGGLYLDPFPRDGKYTHAAVWPVRQSSTLEGRKPISVFVTNLDRVGLTHSEVETLLHELGHALHNIFSQTRYARQGGTAVQSDFVEAPSQMYEEWARRLETLSLIRDYCEECPLMDQELVDRLEEARRFGQGMGYADQRMFAAYDQLLYGPEPVDVMGAWHAMERERVMGETQGSSFPARFGHLANHYGAGYYGYMWSEVIALDMLSAFDGNLMDPEVGARFRHEVLERGGERDAMELVEGFLGREVNSDAFFREITGTRD